MSWTPEELIKRSAFYEKMTEAQREVCYEHLCEVIDQYRNALDKARKAQAAMVPLPHTNEDGTAVVAGCNTRMYNVAAYYLDIARDMKSYLDSYPELAEFARNVLEEQKALGLGRAGGRR